MKTREKSKEDNKNYPESFYTETFLFLFHSLGKRFSNLFCSSRGGSDERNRHSWPQWSGHSGVGDPATNIINK